MAKGFTPIIGLAVVVALAMVAVFGAMSLANPALAAVGSPADAELAERDFSPQSTPSTPDAMGGNNRVILTWNNQKIPATEADYLGAGDWEIRFRSKSDNEQYNPDDWYELDDTDAEVADLTADNIAALNGNTLTASVIFLAGTLNADGDITTTLSEARKVQAYIVGLTNTQNICAQVRVERGTRAAASLPSTEVCTVPMSPPDAVDDLEAEAGPNSVILKWDNANDEDVTKWQFRMASSATGLETADWMPVPNSGANTTGYTVDIEMSGAETFFNVRPLSYDTSPMTEDNPPVEDAGDTVMATPFPSAPTVTASATEEEVTLKWNSKAADKDSGIQYWQTRYKKTADDEWKDWMNVVAPTAPAYIDTAQDTSGTTPVNDGADAGTEMAANEAATAEAMLELESAVVRTETITGLDNEAGYDFEVRAIAVPLTIGHEDPGAVTVGDAVEGAAGSASDTPMAPVPFSPTFTATSLEPGDNARYDLKFQVRGGEMNTLTDELVIKLEDFDVPSSIGVNSIAINVNENSRTTIPEDVSPSGEKIFITIGDLNKDRTGGSQETEGETADFDIGDGAIIHVVIRQSAGVSNPTEGKTYGPVVTVEQVISGTKLIDLDFDKEYDHDNDADTDMQKYEGLQHRVPFVLKLDEEDGGLDTVVMAEGLGFKDGTSLTVFVDKLSPVMWNPRGDNSNNMVPLSANMVEEYDALVVGDDTGRGNVPAGTIPSDEGMATYYDEDDNGNKYALAPNRILDSGEDTVCVASEISKADIGTCEFTVTHPVFNGGVNYLNAVDGRNNYVSASEDLAEFTLEESISLSPQSGNPGEVILVQAVDFDPNATIGRIQLSRRTIEGTTGGRMDGSGSGNISFTIPNWAKAGTQEVRVYVGGKNATKNIIIGGPRITATPQTVVANQRISLVGTGFSPNERLGDSNQAAGSKISIGGDPIDWNKVNDGDDVMVDSGGNWSASVDLPLVEASTGGGEQTIRVTDSDDRTGTTTVTLADRDFEIDPTQGRVGTLSVVRGWGYPGKNDEGESFNVTVQYKVSGDAKVTVSVVPDASGRFEAQVRIPTTAAIPSTNTVEVSFDLEGRDSGRKVVETKQHDVPEGIINLSATSGGPGTTVTLTGEGFKTYVPVRSVKIGSIEVTPSPRPSTDVNGMMEFDLLIPGLDVGIQTLEVQVGSTTASVGFTVVESGVEPGAIKPVAVGVEALGENLVSIWHFNNDTKVWSFYAPVLAEGNTMTHVITGETYLILIKSTTEVILNRETRSLTCVGGNCWNQLVW